MFKNGDEEEIVLPQDYHSIVERGEEVSFTDTKRGYALRLNCTYGKYNLCINEVAYDSLDLEAAQDSDEKAAA